MIRALLRTTLCASLWMAASAAGAFEINPLVHVLRPAAGDGDTSLTIRNTTAQELKVEIRVFELRLGDRGPTRGPPADDRLFALPPAAIVPAGGSQVVRVRWLDPEPLGRDASFVVAVEQVADEASAGAPEVGVQMLLTFNTVVHVETSDSAPDLRVEGPVTSEDGSVRFVLVNDGRGNAYGERVRITLDDGSRRERVLNEDLLVDDIHLFLPPGHRQTVEVAKRAGAWTQPLDIDVDYDAR